MQHAAVIQSVGDTMVGERSNHYNYGVLIIYHYGAHMFLPRHAGGVIPWHSAVECQHFSQRLCHLHYSITVDWGGRGGGGWARGDSSKPVVEDDVWQPDLVGRDVETRHSAIFLRVPHQLVVVPLLPN